MGTSHSLHGFLGTTRTRNDYKLVGWKKCGDIIIDLTNPASSGNGKEDFYDDIKIRQVGSIKGLVSLLATTRFDTEKFSTIEQSV
jgi:hypothetical protein